MTWLLPALASFGMPGSHFEFLMQDNCHVSVCEWKATASPAKNWFHIKRMGKASFPLRDLYYTFPSWVCRLVSFSLAPVEILPTSGR